MAYTRTPNTVIAGLGLKQNPPPSPLAPAGALPVVLDAEIATTTSLGVIQVGSGLSITPEGILSATGGDDCYVNVKLVDDDYAASLTDNYIGTIQKNITITLPLGVKGKVYYLKNQVSGNITVQGSGDQTLDNNPSKTLGTNSSLTLIFDGARWNIL